MIGSRRMACTAALAAIGSSLLPASAECQRTQTITRAELDAAGWTRLSELVFAVRGVARTSVDGITVGGDVGRLPSWSVAANEGWTVLVDGQPVPLVAGGAMMLDLLPVALAQLDSVTMQRVPAPAGGRIAMHGVLHLHTRRRVERLEASASHYSGNEVGDPGPFAFTPEATPNVDNSGPFHQARVAYGTPGWDADGAIRRWTDNITDARMRARYVGAAAPGAPDLWVRHLAPTARVGANVLGGRHDAYAGMARTQGTFFLPTPGEDQSLEMRLAHAGVNGRFAAASMPAATYRVAVSQLEAADYAGALPATLAHQRREISLGAGAEGNPGGFRASLAVSGVHRSLRSAAAIVAPLPESELEADVLAAVESGRGWNPHAALSLGLGVGGVRSAAIVGLMREVDARTTVALRAAAARHALGDGGAWIDLALSGLSALAPERRTSAHASATWSRVTIAGATLEASAVARRETGMRIIAPDSAPSLASVRTRTGGPATLNTGELQTSLELPFGGIALGGATYRFALPIRGTAELNDASATLPRHLFDASVTAAPVLDIRLRTAVHLASGTRWMREGTGEDRVPAIARLDLSVEKWMLARRLRLHALARNLLNDAERYHPLGADFRLRVFVGATASF